MQTAISRRVGLIKLASSNLSHITSGVLALHSCLPYEVFKSLFLFVQGCQVSLLLSGTSIDKKVDPER